MDAENVTSLELYPYIHMVDASHSTYLYGIMDAKVSLQFLVLGSAPVPLILHYTRMEKVEGISHRMVPHLGVHFCIPHDLGVADAECANL